MHTLVRNCCSAEAAMSPASRLGRAQRVEAVPPAALHAGNRAARVLPPERRGGTHPQTSAHLLLVLAPGLRHGRGGCDCAAARLLVARARAAVALLPRRLLRGAAPPRTQAARRRPGGCVAPHRRRDSKTAQIRPRCALGQPFSRSRSPSPQRCAASAAQVSGQAGEGFGGAWCVLLRGRSRRASGGGRILFALPLWLRSDATRAPRRPAPL
jgi:hypothetical protein